MSVISIGDLFKVGPPLTEAEQVGRAASIDALGERAMAGETLRLFDQRREGKTSLALAVLARANAAHLAICNLPLDEYPTAQAAAARILLLARQCAELGGAFGTVNVDVVELALPTVERHEAWQLLRYS
jgi:hypothetical protein